MGFPLFQILSFPDELEKSLNPQSQKIVRDKIISVVYLYNCETYFKLGRKTDCVPQ